MLAQAWANGGSIPADRRRLAALTRMRQAACDPRLTKLSGEWDHESSGKLAALQRCFYNATWGGCAPS